MKIVLLRHGKPAVDLHALRKTRYSSHSLRYLIDAYTQSGLHHHNQPTVETMKVINTCQHIVCSALPRSIESARVLGINDIHLTDPVFNEFTLPHANWHFPRLTLFSWFYLYRLLWMLGYSNNSESVTTARARAKHGTDKLIQLTRHHGSVALIGHGLLNYFIARNLLANGWQGPPKPGQQYWDYAIYESCN